MTYQEAVAYIYNIPKFTKKHTLDQTRALMALIGDPQKDFKYIHVAGTNGKGSVCAMLNAALNNLDVRTGMFTSPHLVKINERIQVDGEMISDEDFLDLFHEIKEVVDDYVADGGVHPTFFEWMYMMAMRWFSTQEVEFAVVETGLGGRLDATNVVDRPEVTVITSIGYDHMQYLGDTIEAIASEKAGIIKPTAPLVFDDNVSVASKVITQIFDECHKPMEQDDTKAKPKRRIAKKSDMYKDLCIAVGRSSLLGSQFAARGLSYDAMIDGCYLRVFVPLLGTYQLMNSLVALNTLAVIGRKNDYLDYEKEDYYELIKEGFANVSWPGRMEKVNKHLYIDGAHNVDGIRGLCQSISRRCFDEDVYLLFAVAEDKDYEEMIKLLCELDELRGVMVTAINNDRRVSVSKVEALFKLYTEAPVRSEEDIQAAFNEAKDWTGDGILCCCGSLYLAGSLKADC